ncbi:hypothetical protein PLESTB_001959600 [Pleodorina starrii]|uniref:SAP domain-containing protein n=1 Tax=Pleodorina starrii TaxID=330485 RepID=A0A9W6C2Z6_9CHLO|nr:hypothetical protein PLESTM_002068700 [Pleodorina starrii]GLC62918.1 hypothetical protein PLESTB_001959600 [Pleodorina starrii]GLC70346.1 hypothetical protein PLESTF_000962600 [Pleodorina starrii]
MLADLNNLPARRLTPCNTVFRTYPCSYVCTHDTEPPDGQVIHTDQSTSALLRIVKKRESSAVGVRKGAEVKNVKRPVDTGSADATDERPAKKPNVGTANGAAKANPTANPSSQHPTASFTADELKAKTVPQLKELLRARGLPVSGAKDELVRRLVDYQRANKYK